VDLSHLGLPRPPGSAGEASAGLPAVAAGLAGVAAASALWPRATAAIAGRLPGIGATSQNVIGHVRGSRDVIDPPLILVAHLDAHQTAGAPLARPHAALAAVVSLGLLAIAIASMGSVGDPSPWLALLALEPAATLAWIANLELVSTEGLTRDDNASGLAALVRVGALVREDEPARDIWLVATGAGTAGSRGMSAYLRAHRDVARTAWVIEIDALGAAALVLVPGRRRFPRAVTPPAVVRAVAGAAIDSGDLIDVRRVPRPHSDANRATAKRVAAVTITGGTNTLGPEEPDAANTERAARIIDRLARTVL